MTRARIRDLVLEGLRCRWMHRLRSLLALLAIAVGILSLTLVSAVIDGLDHEVRSFVGRQIGERVLIVRREPTELRTLRDWKRYAGRRPLDTAELTELGRLADGLGRLGATARWRAPIAHDGRLSAAVEVRGMTAEIPEILGRGLSAGRWFHAGDFSGGRPVCVLGADIATELFGAGEALGATVRVLGRRFTVVGVAERAGELFGASQDAWLAMPLPIFLRRVDQRVSLEIFVEAAADRPPTMVRRELRELLRRVRRRAPGEADDFTIESAADYRELWGDVSGDASLIATAIAAIASLVGGLVILNVLLIDIASRRSEIGLRRSLGARHRDIFTQVVAEAVVLTVLGGAAGIVVGYTAAATLGSVLSLPIAVSGGSVARALTLALAVGLAAGLVPAARAVRLDPIAALRAG